MKGKNECKWRPRTVKNIIHVSSALSALTGMISLNDSRWRGGAVRIWHRATPLNQDNGCSDLHSMQLIELSWRHLWHLFSAFVVLQKSKQWEGKPKRIMGEEKGGMGVERFDRSVGIVTQISLCCTREKRGKEFWVSLAEWQETHILTHIDTH